MSVVSDTVSSILRSAWRSARRRPVAFAAMALSTAIGVGTMAAVLTAGDRVLFRPLDVPEGDRIAAIYGFNERTQQFESTSYQDYLDYQRRLDTFEDLAAYIRLPVRVTAGTDLFRLGGEATTSNYFPMLGIRPLLGGTLDDSRQDAAWPMVAMISERQWRARLAADPAVVGRTMVVEGRPLTIVGVVPDAFTSPNLGWGRRPDLWVPVEAVETLFPTFREARVFPDRSIPSILMLGRLAPGGAIDAARAEVEVVAQSMPITGADERPGVRVFEAGRARFWPAHRETLVRSFAGFALVGALLLGLTCANLMTGLGQQAMSRRQEFAVRRALGAGRGLPAVQVMGEAGALGLAAFLLSLGVAAGSLYVLTLAPGVLGIGLSLDLALDWQAVWLCAALSMAVTLAATVVAFAFSNRRGSAAARSGSRTVTSAMTWPRYALVGAQVTACGALLASTALVASSAANAAAVDPGFEIDRLATVSLEASLDAVLEDDDLAVAAARLEALPGIESVARTSRLPLDSAGAVVRLRTPGDNATVVTAEHVVAGATYFSTLGIDVRRGRGFSDLEADQHLPVAVVSESLASRLWPGETGVGERLAIERQGAESLHLDVVGVVADTRYEDIWTESGSFLYTTQPGTGAVTHLVLRTSAPATPASIAAIRRALPMLPAGLNVVDVQTGAERFGSALAPIRSAGAFFGGLAAIAAFVSLLGLHATLGHTVQERTREVVLRQALGATPLGAVVAILRAPMLVALAAAVAGGVCAMAIAPLLVGQTRGLESSQLVVFALSAALVAGACAVVAGLSGVRALRLPLADTLRGSE